MTKNNELLDPELLKGIALVEIAVVDGRLHDAIMSIISVLKNLQEKQHKNSKEQHTGER